MKSISVEELLKLDTNNITIIDVREIDEFQSGHINGVTNIPAAGLFYNPDKFLDIHNHYYLICESGGRSSAVCNQLTELGYNVTNVSGGMSMFRLLKGE